MLKFPSILAGGKRTDAAILALFAVLGAIPSVIVFTQRKYTFFYQNFTPESVMWACGYGLRHPQAISDQLAAFLLGKVQSFDCSTIDPNGAFGPVAIFASGQPWITWLAAVLWRLLGVNQTAMLPLVAVLAGLYAAGCYALSRLFLGRLLAIVAGAVLCVSPVATEMALFLRDSSKGPFFIWAVVFLILALRSRLARAEPGLCCSRRSDRRDGLRFQGRSRGHRADWRSRAGDIGDRRRANLSVSHFRAAGLFGGSRPARLARARPDELS